MKRLFSFTVLSLALLPVACQRQQFGEPLRLVPQISPVEPRRVLFSPVDESRLLVMESNGSIGVWEISNTDKPELFATIRTSTIDAAFSPDGRFVATAGSDGRLRWWHADGRLEWVSRGSHDGPARAIAVGPDFIATGGEDGTVRLWSRDGAALGEPLKGHDRSLVSLAVSPRGDLVSVGAEDAVRLWRRVESAGASAPSFEPEVLHRAQTPRYADHFVSLVRYDVSWGWDSAADFSPKGDLLAVALLDESLRLWDADGKARAVLPNAHPQRHVRAVSFSPTGDMLATAGFDGMVRLWNLDGSEHRTPIPAHYGIVFSVAFSPSGNRIATAGRDNTVRIWSRDGSQVSEFPHGHKDRVTAVALAPDKPLLAVADRSGGVRTWSFGGEPHGTLLRGQEGQKNALATLAFSPKQGLLAGGRRDGTLWLWQEDGKPVGKPLTAGRELTALGFAPQSDLLAVGSVTFQLWKDGGRLWQQALRPADRVVSIAFSPRGDFVVTGSSLGDVQVWSLDGTPRTAALKQRWEYINAVAVPPSADFFAAVVGGTKAEITLFNLDGSPRGVPLEGHLATTTALQFAPDGRLVSGSKDGTVRFWTLPAGPVETIEVGLPVDQLGFWRDRLWVRAGGEWLFFYDADRKLIGTIILRRDSVLSYTSDGWYSGPARADRYVRLFTESGEALPPPDVLRRMSPSRVRQVLAGRN